MSRTSGELIVAGSRPILSSRIGNIEPIVTPQITMPRIEMPTVSPTALGSVAVAMPAASSPTTTRYESRPSASPRMSPVRISVTITRFQSLCSISSSEIARIRRLAACVPVFPPDEMISGMNETRIAAFSSWLWNISSTPIVATCKSSSTQSQPPRFLIISARPVCM